VTPAGTYNYLVDRVAPLPVVIREEGPEGTIDYVHGATLISALGSTFQHFYQFDGVGSVVSVTDGGGALKQHYGYDPWGNPLWADALGARNKYRFTSEPWDAASGLYHFRARYYDPTLGRFVSRDPWEDAYRTGGLFEYALSNPLRFADATGQGLIDFPVKASVASSRSGAFRDARAQAMYCDAMSDKGCDDVTMRYTTATKNALREGLGVVQSGASVPYAGPAVSGGLNTELFEPESVPWYLHKGFEIYQTASEVWSAAKTLLGRPAPSPTDSPYTSDDGGLPQALVVPAQRGSRPPRK